MRNRVLASGLSLVLAALPLVAGCFPSNLNPLAAASAAAKLAEAIEGAATDADALGAVATALGDLTASELASAINFAAGEDWTTAQAESIIELAQQFNADNIDQLTSVEFDEGVQTDEQIQQTLSDAGITASAEQVALLRDLFTVFEGAT